MSLNAGKVCSNGDTSVFRVRFPLLDRISCSKSKVAVRSSVSKGNELRRESQGKLTTN